MNLSNWKYPVIEVWVSATQEPYILLGIGRLESIDKSLFGIKTTEILNIASGEVVGTLSSSFIFGENTSEIKNIAQNLLMTEKLNCNYLDRSVPIMSMEPISRDILFDSPITSVNKTEPDLLEDKNKSIDNNQINTILNTKEACLDVRESTESLQSVDSLSFISTHSGQETQKNDSSYEGHVKNLTDKFMTIRSNVNQLKSLEDSNNTLSGDDSSEVMPTHINDERIHIFDISMSGLSKHLCGEESQGICVQYNLTCLANCFIKVMIPHTLFFRY
jgi:hypothetical protein